MSTPTSFSRLFLDELQLEDGAPVRITGIEIPTLQRDYAQGRESLEVTSVRERFLASLHAAASGGPKEALDFIYGQITSDGRLVPLDGQQRLTTLFLLHWYVDAQVGVQVPDPGATPKLRYETRVSAGEFCSALSAARPFPLPPETPTVSAWFRDQTWFSRAWSRDATIAGMLVMLDAIHERFAGTDCQAAWDRLNSVQDPAISFHFLPIAKLGRPDDLYIKMNSRGRPLSAFENFKANFERILEDASPVDHDTFAERVDNAWAALFWPMPDRDSKRWKADTTADTEFLRYFLFLVEVIWHSTSGSEHVPASDLTLEDVADQLFGTRNPDGAQAARNRRFLFAALDCWCPAHGGVDAARFFGEVFSLDVHHKDRVTLHRRGEGATIDLLGACCMANVSEVRQLQSAGERAFSLNGALYLYACLVHLTGGLHHPSAPVEDRAARARPTSGFVERLRVVRNLVEASDVRLERLGGLLRGVALVIAEGVDADLSGTPFEPRQVREERLKRDVLRDHTTLAAPVRQLEDHRLLLGCVTALLWDREEVAPAALERRARAFEAVFPSTDLRAFDGDPVGAALLACGDYSQRLDVGGNHFQLGSADRFSVWRTLLTRPDFKSQHHRIRAPLGRLLDLVADVPPAAMLDRLHRIACEFTEGCEARGELDWRYYLVRYACTREGASGRYVGLSGALGPSLCMMEGSAMNGYYRDPLLLAVARTIGPPYGRLQGGVRPDWRDPWFTGGETVPRWLTLATCGARLRFVDSTVALEPPTHPGFEAGFEAVLAARGATAGRVPIPQTSVGGVLVDARDRVQLAAAIARDLLALHRAPPP